MAVLGRALFAKCSTSILRATRLPSQAKALGLRWLTHSTANGFASNVASTSGSVNSSRTFSCNDLEFEFVSAKSKKPEMENISFGRYFSDHMLDVHWTLESGWGAPRIRPTSNIVLHPAAKVLHYGQALFEGLKAYRGPDGEVRLFRPDLNVERMLTSAAALGLPLFEAEQLRKCITRLVDLDREWVPSAPSTSLYIRPTFIGTEPTLGVAESNQALLYVITSPVGPYYGSDALKPVSLLADSKYTRAWPGGTGDKKLACNYAPTLAIQRKAASLGLDQVLWLFGPDQQITEVGSMNVFILKRSKDGEPELVTPPLSGIILPGITRRSVLELAREWKEFKVSERDMTIREFRDTLEDGRIIEMFGTGTAAIVSPIERIIHRTKYKEKELLVPTMKSRKKLFSRVMRTLMDIQYGIVDHPWSVIVKRYNRI